MTKPFYSTIFIMNLRPVLLMHSFIFLWSCSNDDEPTTINQEADNFLNEVLTIMENNSINKNEIDWDDFRNQIFNEAGTAQTIDETYGAIRLALTLLNDNHSFFIRPDGSRFNGRNFPRCTFEDFESPSLPENIGYVAVSSFTGSNDEESLAFAESIQQKIAEDDNENISGWIVDLRGNAGGNMWPMLAGLGPILGEGVAGYFITPDDNEFPWSYTNGASISGQNPIVQLSNPYDLINPNPKVAVLIDNGVASSGEAIAVSFIGRSNTKSFGSATCGLSTGNSTFNLSNSSTLFLTTVYFADRDKNQFGGQLLPDVESDNQTIIEDAIEYIEN